MNIFSMTANSSVKRIVLFFAFATTLLLLNGCTLIAPPIFYPKTSVHGVVLDQQGNPVPDVKIEVCKENPITKYVYDAGAKTWYIRSDEEGKWQVSARKVGRLFLEAIPPKGYMEAYDPILKDKGFTGGFPADGKSRAAYIGPFHSGQCPTNSYTLWLRKLDDGEK